MFAQTINRVGFACKINQTHDKAWPGLNTGTTTITWLNAQPKPKAIERLWSILVKNTDAVVAQLQWLAKHPPHLRMLRLSSDLLPAYTHDRKSTRLNSSHVSESRLPSSA